LKLGTEVGLADPALKVVGPMAVCVAQSVQVGSCSAVEWDSGTTSSPPRLRAATGLDAGRCRSSSREVFVKLAIPNPAGRLVVDKFLMGSSFSLGTLRGK